jgi:hypothetical protein
MIPLHPAMLDTSSQGILMRIHHAMRMRFSGLFRTVKTKKPSTTEAFRTQRKAREAKVIPGFPAFDFLCALSVSVVDGFLLS